MGSEEGKTTSELLLMDGSGIADDSLDVLEHPIEMIIMTKIKSERKAVLFFIIIPPDYIISF